MTDAIANLEFQVDDPNERAYASINLGTWSSVSDVDTFFSRFNRSTIYKDGNTKLRLGNYVTIQDGAYNSIWEIAGFDMEHNQKAADGTVYDNGYGICMIPKTHVTIGKWSTSDTTGGYKSSYIHGTTLSNIVTYLKTILGSHMVNRNVLLSSSVANGSYNSNAYTWTTAYATLMSIGQMNGTFAAKNNKYDDGEANYKLPLFNSKDFKTGSTFWSRGIGGGYIWCVNSDGSIAYYPTNDSLYVRPLIYLR